MKIFIRTLLPTIVVLIHIRELNFGDPGEGSQPQWINTMNDFRRKRAQQQPNSVQPETSQAYQPHTLQLRQPQKLQEPHRLQVLQPETSQTNQPHTLQLRQPQQLQEPHRLQVLQPETSQTNQPHTLQLRKPQQLQEPHPLQALQTKIPRLCKRPRTEQQPSLLPRRHEPYQRHTLHLLEPQLQPEPHELKLLQPQELQLQQDLHKLQLLHPHSDIHILKTPVIIDCLNQKIKASVAIIDEEITTVACELIADPPFIPFIPDINYKKKNNYVTRECRKNTIVCVAYVHESGKVFGTKLPPNPNHYLRAGDPARLNPNPFTSFITCKNQDYEVTEDPQTKMVQRIRLLPKNRHPSQNDGNNNITRTGDLLCCGVRFMVYRTKNGHIVGAEVDQKIGPQFILNNNPMPIM